MAPAIAFAGGFAEHVGAHRRQADGAVAQLQRLVDGDDLKAGDGNFKSPFIKS
ncbi:MAG: hypothetical protein P8N68_05785 [Paracoccaceae bacterium]|nr:hypothetical protein [Paracoccaceae bacterium]